MQGLRIGVMALTDSAPFVVARELGLFQARGLEVELCWQPSWATLRDKLAYGEIQAAHMLSPMAVALHLGLGGSPKKEMKVPLILNTGGNAVTVSNALAQKLASLADGQTLGSALRAGKSRGEPGLVFGTVFPFSMHTLQLRRWLRLNDIDPEQDIRIEVVPPSRMVGFLEAARLDAFCVGEPYNSLAVNKGLGQIAATSHDLWRNAPEKVLGCTKAWAEQNADALIALSTALQQACEWLSQGPANRSQAAAWLSEPDCVNLPRALIETALLSTVKGSTSPFIHFDGNSPTKDQSDLFESLVVETCSLVGRKAVEPAQLAGALTAFGL